MNRVHPVVVPQLNVNDEVVRLVQWLVKEGAFVTTGEMICELETSKSIAEIPAEKKGVIYPLAKPESLVKVGERIGLIGESSSVLQDYLNDEKKRMTEETLQKNEVTSDAPKATAKAKELANQKGISLKEIASFGVVGTIKETDVVRYLQTRTRPISNISPAEAKPISEPDLPPGIFKYLSKVEELPRHEQSVVLNLRKSLARLLLATIEVRLDLSEINRQIKTAKTEGTMMSLLHLVVHALGQTLPHFPRLISILQGNTLYRYNQIDISFVVRSLNGRLYTPVVRGADKLSLKETSKICQALAMKINRGKITPEELDGACFTVSHISGNRISRFFALPNLFQSSILAIAGEKEIVSLKEGKLLAKPETTLTLSYDHSLCDGVYTADFLQELIKKLEGGVL